MDFLCVSTRDVSITQSRLDNMIFVSDCNWKIYQFGNRPGECATFLVQINLQIKLQRVVINLYVTGFTWGIEHL